MNDQITIKVPPILLKRPRWIAPSWMADLPHIYYKDGYWRVTQASSKKLFSMYLYNRAHDFVSRLNNHGPTIPQPTPLRNEKKL